MSKTHKDVMKFFDKNQPKKRRSEASARFKTERKRKDERKLYAFTTWIERTAQEN